MALHGNTAAQAEPQDAPQQQRAALISVTCFSSGKRDYFAVQLQNALMKQEARTVEP